MSKLDGASNDALSRTIYARTDINNEQVSPITCNTDGSLNINIKEGFDLPVYDEIEIVYTGSTVSMVIYKNGGSSVGTISLVYSGSTLTGIIKT